jgi:hypothetical protein
MEVLTINWPRAFVIAVAMICGAFLINKPSDAAFGGGGGMIVAVGDGRNQVWQLKEGVIRFCLNDWQGATADMPAPNNVCSSWTP